MMNSYDKVSGNRDALLETLCHFAASMFHQMAIEACAISLTPRIANIRRFASTPNQDFV